MYVEKAGLLAAGINYNTTAFGGQLQNQAKGFDVGPYFGYQISPKWSTDGSLTYGQLKNNNQLSILNSQFVTQFINSTLHATGLYQFGNFQLRPQPLISYSYFRNPAYQMNGNILNTPIQVTQSPDEFYFGYGEFKLEANESFVTKKGNIFQPYTDASVDYRFARPNQGQILTGNLTLATTSPWSEALTVGLRGLFSKRFLVDISGGYMSFGQNGLNVWGVKLMGSYSFS